MFAISSVVLIVVLFLCSGRAIPPEISQYLNEIIGRDGNSTEQLIAAGYVTGMLASMTPLRLALRYFVTVVHELGHAFMAGALFARPKTVYIHPSSSGLATWEIPENWGKFRATLVAAAGYPAPSLASLAAINAVIQGRSIAWSIFSVAILALALLLLIRNMWGFVWTAGVIVASYFACQQVPIELAGATVAFVGGFLAVNSVQFSWIQLRLVRNSRGSGVDAEAIESYLRIPASLISIGHLLICVFVGFLATKLAVEPVWNDFYGWVREIY